MSQAIEFHKKHKGKIQVSSKIGELDSNNLTLAYTPGVAEVSEAIYENPELANELTLKSNTIAIISDGSAVLGLGNLGPAGAIPVMEGKATLFKQFGNVDAFPICLNTQDIEEIIKTIKNISPVFGGINLEDIAAPNCFIIEKRLQEELDIPVFHDDQQGTAIVVLAALINAIEVANLDVNAKLVINGAGAAGTAIAKLVNHYGFNNLIICDSQGIISSKRDKLTTEKSELLQISNQQDITGDLYNALNNADIFIGVSKGNLLTAEHIKIMSPEPIIFALANPIPEIMPDEAKKAGAYIVATGRSDFPNQINNVLAFPGIFRGALNNHISKFNTEMFINASKAIAKLVQSPSPENIIPSIFTPNLAEIVAKEIK